MIVAVADPSNMAIIDGIGFKTGLLRRELGPCIGAGDHGGDQQVLRPVRWKFKDIISES